MIEVLNAEQDNILEIKAMEKMSPEDLNKLTPVLEDHVDANEEPRLLVLIEKFKGWTEPAAFWKDFELDAKFIGKFSRIAVAGDREWEKWMVKIFAPLTPGEIKYFDIRDLPRARTWLQD